MYVSLGCRRRDLLSGGLLYPKGPNNHLFTQNLYDNYYYPKPKYLSIGYLDPLGYFGITNLQGLGSAGIYAPKRFWALGRLQVHCVRALCSVIRWQRSRASFDV